MTGGEPAGLLAVLGPGQRPAGGWDFTTNVSYVEVLLSYDVGLGLSEDNLSVWRLQGSV